MNQTLLLSPHTEAAPSARLVAEPDLSRDGVMARSDARLWVLFAALLAVFALDVALPDVVLLPFLAIPVVAAATFATPRATALVAVLALGLGIGTGLTDHSYDQDDYLLRLAGMALVSALAVFLARLRLQREARLADRELHFRLIADNAADAVFLVDDAGVIGWCSPSVSVQLGYAPDALIGRQRLDLVHYEDRRTVSAQWAQAVLGEQVRYEERFLLRDGTYRWMSVAVRPFLGPDGQDLGRVAALRDIHEEVITRSALQASERTFHQAMAGAAQGMAVVGLHRRFLEVNDALCSVVGHDAAWLLDHAEADIMTEEDAKASLAAGDRLLAGGDERIIRHGLLLCADGEIVAIEHAIGLVRDQHGMPLFFVCQYPLSAFAGAVGRR